MLTFRQQVHCSLNLLGAHIADVAAEYMRQVFQVSDVADHLTMYSLLGNSLTPSFTWDPKVLFSSHFEEICKLPPLYTHVNSNVFGIIV